MGVSLMNAIYSMKNITFASFLSSRKSPSVGSRSSSKCSGHYYNKLATDFDDFNVDIFDSSQQQEKNVATDASKLLLAKVLHRLGNIHVLLELGSGGIDAGLTVQWV